MPQNRNKAKRALRQNGEVQALLDRWKQTKAHSNLLSKDLQDLKKELEPVLEDTRKLRAAVLADIQRTPPVN